MTIHKESLIARRAYEIWEEAGRPHGLDREHWHQAAAEIEQNPVLVNGDAPVHATPSTVMHGDAPVHTPAPAAAKPPKPVVKAVTAPAKTKAAAPKASPAAAAKKAPAKPKAK